MSFPPTGQSGASAAIGSPAVVELAALLGRGTRYTGKLFFEGRVRIEGHFQGEIRGADVLIIGEGAEIEGDIEVGACIVTGGRVIGNIRARDAIELHVPAVVHGDLHAPAIFIDRGVTFEGRCRMAPLDAPETPPAAARTTDTPSPPAHERLASAPPAPALEPVLEPAPVPMAASHTVAGEPRRDDES